MKILNIKSDWLFLKMNYLKITFIILLLLDVVACNCSNKKNSLGLNTQVKEELKKSEFKYRSLNLFNRDTVLYLKANYIINKQNFIGNNIKYLLKNLELPVYKYLYSPTYYEPHVYNHISLQFTNDVVVQNHINNKQAPLILILDFEQPISMVKMREIQAITKGKWGSDAIELFGNEKIKDIEMVTKGF